MIAYICKVIVGLLLFVVFVMTVAAIGFLLETRPHLQFLWHRYILRHRYWYFGWGRFRQNVGLGLVYDWWIQMGPLEIRKWK